MVLVLVVRVRCTVGHESRLGSPIPGQEVDEREADGKQGEVEQGGDGGGQPDVGAAHHGVVQQHELQRPVAGRQGQRPPVTIHGGGGAK